MMLVGGDFVNYIKELITQSHEEAEERKVPAHRCVRV